jgi:hypothetical protein
VEIFEEVQKANTELLKPNEGVNLEELWNAG